MFGIGETGDTLDYGFKLIPEEENKNMDKYPHLKQFEPSEEHSDIPEDAFLMVTQLPWEDDIIWNADDVSESEGCYSILLWNSSEGKCFPGKIE